MFVQALRSEYRIQDHGSYTSSSQETSLTKDAFSHIELSAKRRNALFLHPDNDEQAEEHKAFLNDVQYRYLNPNVHKASTTPQDVVLDHRLSRAGQTAEFLSRLPQYIAPEARGGTNSQAGGQGSTRAKKMKRASIFEADQTPVVPRSDNRKGNRILKLDDVSDLLYPNIDVSRQRQPSALMLVAGVGSKQKTPSCQQGSLLQEDALRNTSDALNETLICPRVVGAVFSAPSYAPSKQQPADSSKQRHPVLGSNSSGSVLKATGLVEQLPETPQYEVVLPSAPAARFSKAPRWSQAPKSKDHEKDTVHSFPGPQDSAERRGLQEAFDAAAAYNAVLPRVAAAWFSKTKRFKDAGDDWQQQERCQPKFEEYCLSDSTEWSQGVDPSGKPSLLMSKKGVRNKASVVATDSVGDVEAAKDFIKPRKPVASFGHTSVKEAMLKEMEKRKRTVQERLHAQERHKETIKGLKGCIKVIGSGSLGEGQGPQAITELMNATSTASPSVLGNTASFEQPSSPDRMLNHRRGTQAPSHLSLSHGVDACDGANNISHIGSNKWDGGVLDWLKRSYSVERERVAGRSISPRWELLQRRVTTPSFSGYASRSVSVGGAMPGAPMRSEMVGRYSRRPGPGSYLHAEDAHASLSYVARPPSTTIPRAQLPRFLMEGETGSAWQPTAAALEMWSQADPGAAKDRLRPRAPGVVIGTEVRLKVDPVPHADDEAQVGGGGVTDFQLQIRYDLVEPRLIGLVNMRASLRQALVVNQLPAESNSGVEGVEDPWALDQAVRVLKPSWSFKAASRWAAAAYDRELVRRQRDLEPSYSFGRHRVQGIPNFAAFLTSRSRLGKGAVWREPAVGAYDLERAWHFLAMHVPARIMAAAEDRWRLPSRAALELGGDQMVLELSQALALVQPQAPAWSFAPIPTSVRRVHEVQTIMSHLEVEFAVAFVKRRTPGMPTFEHQMGRVLKAEEQKFLEEMSRLGPGAYEPRHGCIERRATTFPFEKYLDHGIFSSDDDDEDLSAQGEQNKGHTMLLEELPEGARLRLDVLSAKDATLRRTKFVVIMKGMPGRGDVLASSHAGIPHGGYTNHLPLPDPELDLLSSTRRRVHQVDFSGLGHQPLVQHDPEDVRRGPGMYHLADNFTLAGARGPAWDFGKPSAPHAVIQSEHSVTNVNLAERRNQERLYQSAVYLYSLDMVRPVPPRPPTFHLSSGRGCDSTSNPSQTYLLDYHVEDIPLTVLAGYRRAPTGPDFHTNLPHASALPTCGCTQV
ncbi:hypothetical protein CEUSTIGMA_g227.t1 [Chlamydomonas eustigma]|uniref:Uncharacterized protein n=1 Tax=Chlamydomonas eustigma TaxID=1157962 RepID=A0A250WPQ2_9CHLO|nr:hypothetical protein CEUSTIGMA_g227.t1 [Chlamydomonas eustigma]|eukprot:GAX72771.1 hypothetical protein CEUSTIGMA_g227.t1 [Chlamydomonas eustigma]